MWATNGSACFASLATDNQTTTESPLPLRPFTIWAICYVIGMRNFTGESTLCVLVCIFWEVRIGQVKNTFFVCKFTKLCTVVCNCCKLLLYTPAHVQRAAKEWAKEIQMDTCVGQNQSETTKTLEMRARRKSDYMPNLVWGRSHCVLAKHLTNRVLLYAHTRTMRSLSRVLCVHAVSYLCTATYNERTDIFVYRKKRSTHNAKDVPLIMRVVTGILCHRGVGCGKRRRQ